MIDEKPCCAYLPANAGSRTIKAAIQKAAQIKKFLVSIMLVFMCSPLFVRDLQMEGHATNHANIAFNINRLADERCYFSVSIYPTVCLARHKD